MGIDMGESGSDGGTHPWDKIPNTLNLTPNITHLFTPCILGTPDQLDSFFHFADHLIHTITTPESAYLVTRRGGGGSVREEVGGLTDLRQAWTGASQFVLVAQSSV